MFDTLLSLIAPHACIQCGVEGPLWCDDCRGKTPRAIERCYRCHKLSPNGRTCVSCHSSSCLYNVQAATRYEGYAKRLVWLFKFERARASYKPIVRLMADRIVMPDDVTLTHVPTSTGRVRRRSYDQAALVARYIAKRSSVPYGRLLIRLGQQQQHTATRRQRLVQLERAFTVPCPEVVAGKHVVLVDDVITTGATLNAAAKALKAAGAKRISAIVFAQV